MLPDDKVASPSLEIKYFHLLLCLPLPPLQLWSIPGMLHAKEGSWEEEVYLRDGDKFPTAPLPTIFY